MSKIVKIKTPSGTYKVRVPVTRRFIGISVLNRLRTRFMKRVKPSIKDDVEEKYLKTDELELLEEIRITQHESKYEERPEFLIDEEFSNLCCEVWK